MVRVEESRAMSGMVVEDIATRTLEMRLLERLEARTRISQEKGGLRQVLVASIL